MSGMITGVVDKVWENVTSTGKKTFAVTVDGKRYSAGFDKLPCVVGDTVTFSVTMNGQYENVTKGSMKVAKAAEASPAGAAPRSAGSYGGDNRQDIISRQAASNTALQFLSLLQSVGGLDIKASAKAEDKVSALEGLVDHYVAHFYEQNTGQPYKSIAPGATAAVAEAAASDGWDK